MKRFTIVFLAVLLLASCVSPDVTEVRHSVVNALNGCSGVSLADYTTNGVTDWVGWIAALNAGNNGYVPTGTYYLNDFDHATGRPINWITASNITVCGDGSSSVIIVDTSPTGHPLQGEYGFWIELASGVTIRDLKLIGNGWGTRDGNGGVAVRFDSTPSGAALRLTLNNWGTVGVDSYFSTGTLIQSDTIVMNGHLSQSMGIWVRGDGAGTISNIIVEDNYVRDAVYEGIVVSGRSGVTVQRNTVDSCVWGISLLGDPGTAQYNVVRNNIVRNAGGPRVDSSGAETLGFGILLANNASHNDIIGNRVEDTHVEAGPTGTTGHNIAISSLDTQTGNRIMYNTTSWSQKPSFAPAGIWNGGDSTIIDFNVIKNGPFGIANQQTAEVKQNNFISNSQNIYGTSYPYSCNRFDGTLQPGCSIYCPEGSCTLIGGAQGTNYSTAADCTGNEYVISSNAYTFNATGTRGNGLRYITFRSYRDASGACWSTDPFRSSSFQVYR